jgi:hypothetical protein
VSVNEEFTTVDLILGSESVTRGVDAFALSVIKAERQVRKLFTYLVFQFPAFDAPDIAELRATLGASRKVYFQGFVAGIDALSPQPVSAFVGADYDRLRSRLGEAIDHRNKILHGQLTARSLSRPDLLEFVRDIRTWCESLGGGAMKAVAYDGFGRDSFHKSSKNGLAAAFKVQFLSMTDYAAFIRANMER